MRTSESVGANGAGGRISRRRDNCERKVSGGGIDRLMPPAAWFTRPTADPSANLSVS